MGWTSYDDFINKCTTLGQFGRTDWNKLAYPTTAQAAGEWHFLFGGQGNPTAGLLTGGTNLSFQSCCEESAGAIMIGRSPSSGTKHIIGVNAYSAQTTTMPMNFLLVDLLGFVPDSNLVTTGDQAVVNTAVVTFTNATEIMNHAAVDIASFSRVQFTLSGGSLPAELSLATDYWTVRQTASTSKLYPTYKDAAAGTNQILISTDGTPTITANIGLPRYTDGAGVQCMCVNNVAAGAGTGNYRITYTNALGATTHVTPGTLPVGGPSMAGRIVYSGTGVGKYGPGFPLAAADTGIRKLEQIYRSATQTSGSQAWCLFKILTDIPMTTVGVVGERNLMHECPSLPRIYDGACLALLAYPGAATPANSSFNGKIEYGWAG